MIKNKYLYLHCFILSFSSFEFNSFKYWIIFLARDYLTFTAIRNHMLKKIEPKEHIFLKEHFEATLNQYMKN